jgi:hypothetical protein
MFLRWNFALDVIFTFLRTYTENTLPNFNNKQNLGFFMSSLLLIIIKTPILWNENTKWVHFDNLAYYNKCDAIFTFLRAYMENTFPNFAIYAKRTVYYMFLGWNFASDAIFTFLHAYTENTLLNFDKYAKRTI